MNWTKGRMASVCGTLFATGWRLAGKRFGFTKQDYYSGNMNHYPYPWHRGCWLGVDLDNIPPSDPVLMTTEGGCGRSVGNINEGCIWSRLRWEYPRSFLLYSTSPRLTAALSPHMEQVLYEMNEKYIDRWKATNVGCDLVWVWQII